MRYLVAKTRLKGESSIFYKKSHKLWCAQISTGIYNGKQARKTIYGKTMTEVKEKMNKIRAKIELQSYINPSNILTKDWMFE